MFGLSLTIVVAIALAVIPLVGTAGSRAPGALKQAGRGQGGSGWRRTGSTLVLAELIIALVLLINAGLLGRSLYRLLHVESGFATEQLIEIGVTPSAKSPTGERHAAVAQRVAVRAAAVPGAVSTAFVDLAPLSAGIAPAGSLWVPGRPADAQRTESGPLRRKGPANFGRWGRPFAEEASSVPTTSVKDAT